MTTPILDRVEQALASFRPRTRREFVALQIARRFSDEGRLAAYIAAANQHSSDALIEAARLAMKQCEETRRPAGTIFFELLEQSGKEAA